jgi:hypothetical protein
VDKGLPGIALIDFLIAATIFFMVVSMFMALTNIKFKMLSAAETRTVALNAAISQIEEIKASPAEIKAMSDLIQKKGGAPGKKPATGWIVYRQFAVQDLPGRSEKAGLVEVRSFQDGAANEVRVAVRWLEADRNPQKITIATLLEAGPRKSF